MECPVLHKVRLLGWSKASSDLEQRASAEDSASAASAYLGGAVLSIH
jgi:hypothetical protein